MNSGWVESLGLVAAVVLPLWNIPLMVRMARRRSSRDISLAWVLGVWVCTLLMAPSGITSADLVWRTFNWVNLILFSGVVVVALKFRNGK